MISTVFCCCFFSSDTLQLCFAVLSHSVVSNSLQPHRLQPTRLLCPWGYSRPEYWSGLPCLLLGALSNPEIKPRSPTLWPNSLLSEPPGKPMNTRVGSLSLLWRIFLTQEWNQGLLLCRWILYQLSYQGSPSAEKVQNAPSVFSLAVIQLSAPINFLER